ncbi:hypothetical protein KQ939_13785 [Planococcus sp. CP5-4]|uniref:hypothetical protein n=1 Tax=unclassified Planococcus (in: firmicutes) TaxID=2662419 RepID=UPI001C240717|nr:MULTISPECIES: hypothetical protein [unclassified Planococcus (in: firmicutes)]MBU9674005.1 hypothetical protein [Planococcus sp. CP5-4_YE]MBV0909876.1 hypothetical protein [Planococcus sp. CP5-4_UN]MBW6064756.1 hypothetical protein [Planococcus sp. CP5-4]
MKRLSLRLLILFFGCMPQPQITESEAIAIIEQLHTNSFGTAEVISIDYRFGRYAVEWENEGNCEWDINHVDGDDGSVEMKQASIC